MSSDCSICYQTIGIGKVVTDCGHIFCCSCYTIHVIGHNEYSNKCPICREVLYDNPPCVIDRNPSEGSISDRISDSDFGDSDILTQRETYINNTDEYYIEENNEIYHEPFLNIFSYNNGESNLKVTIIQDLQGYNENYSKYFNIYIIIPGQNEMDLTYVNLKVEMSDNENRICINFTPNNTQLENKIYNLDLPFNIVRNEITRNLDPAWEDVDNYICKTILDDPYGPYIEPINVNRFNQIQTTNNMLPVSSLVFKMTTNNFSTINDMGNLMHSIDVNNQMGSHRLAHDASYYKIFESKLKPF